MSDEILSLKDLEDMEMYYGPDGGSKVKEMQTHKNKNLCLTS